MSAASLPRARHFEARLAELRSWRRATTEALAVFRRWALAGRLVDEQTGARLAHLERRLEGERLTVAFVGEVSRGKSELVNALFFADAGERLVPSGLGQTTLCPVEILWDEARAPSLRLLPIETRADAKALREYLAHDDGWVQVAIDPKDSASVVRACRAIAQTRRVEPAEAASLGFESANPGPLDVPRWRYAVLNLPHPLLQSGLAILDTPGHNALGLEPELVMHRLPDAAAIVFMLGADTGVTRTDRELWNDHIEPVQGPGHTCYVVLNKIDGLRDGFKPETQVLEEIDRQVRATAESLHVDPQRVFALSARQGLMAKMQDDRDGLLRSRLYRLEQALANGVVQQRRLDHVASLGAETRAAFAEARALIDSRSSFAQQQLAELTALQGRSQRLVETLTKKANAERARLEQARAVMMGLRVVHNRQAEELAQLLDPNLAREAAIHARADVLQSAFSKGIGEALDAYFGETRARIQRAITVIGEARTMMASVGRKFSEDYQIGEVEVPEFATDRFLIELDRLEARCAQELKGASSLLLRGRATLGALFFDTVALKVLHVFEIADREVRTWMNGFIRPLDAQLAAFQEQTNSRIEGMGRVQDAETGLVARMEELTLLMAQLARQREGWEQHHRRLMALLDVEPAPSLA
ncbi:MAG TPA: dynamin family protein [Usitatibacter sp.]|nr:dynamin family protein [Usitatibacter sp.]